MWKAYCTGLGHRIWHVGLGFTVLQRPRNNFHDVRKTAFTRGFLRILQGISGLCQGSIELLEDFLRKLRAV